MTQDLSSANSGSRRLDATTLALLALLGLLLFVYGGLITSYASIFPQRDDYNAAEEVLFAPRGGSPMLVFGVAVLLFYSRLRALRVSLSNPPWIAAGVVFVALATLLGLWAHYTSALDLMIPSLIFMLLGSAALLGGRAALRIVAAPSVFLVFAFPLPTALVNELVWPLQLWTARSATWILSTLGYQPENWGDIILARNKAFHVIETCSGMGMIQTMLMAGSLYAILFYRSRLQAVLILLAAPLIAYLVNAVRVVSIVVNPYATWTSVHTTQGIAVVVAGVLLIAAFDWVLARVLAPRPPEARPEAVAAATGSPHWGAYAVLVGVLLAQGIANQVVPPWKPDRYPQSTRITLPQTLAGSLGKGIGNSKAFIGSVGFTNSSNREYEIDGIPVTVALFSDQRLDRRHSLLSPKNAFPGPGWAVESAGQTELYPGAGEVDYKVLRSRNQRLLSYSWYEGLGPRRAEIVRNALGLDQSPLRRNGSLLAVRMSTPIRGEREGFEAARSRLSRAARVLEEAKL